MTKKIYERFKTVEGAPKSTFGAALYVAQLNKIQLTKPGQLPLATGRRLGTMVLQNKVVRHHGRKTSDYGYWALAPEFFQG